MNWTEEENENLNKVIYKNIKEIYKCDISLIYANTNIINRIKDDFSLINKNKNYNLKTEEEKNICLLWKLNNRIFSKTNQKDEEGRDVFKKLKFEFEKIFDIKYNSNIDNEITKLFHILLKKEKTTEDLILSISESLNINEYETVYYLIKNLFLEFKGYFILKEPYKFELNENYIKNFKQKLKVDSIHINRINQERIHLGKIFNGFNKNSPSFTSVNDGTGFGKSYALFNEYINNVPCKLFKDYTKEEDKRNLIFLTPQKAQIDIDIEQIKSATEKGIKILPILGLKDISDPLFINWVSKKTNEEVLNEIIKDKAFSKYKDLKTSISFCINSIKFINDKIKKKEFHDKSKEEYENDIEELKENFLNKLQNLCKNVVKTKKIEDIFIKNDSVSNLIDYLSPLTRAEFYPTIYVATSSKFESGVSIISSMKKNKSSENKEFDHTFKTINFYDYIGRKKIKKEDETSISEPEIIDDIKSDFFEVDKLNPFEINKISFDIFIDEEHKSYSDALTKKIIPLVNQNSQIEHVLSTVYRLLKIHESEIDNGIEPEVIKEITIFFNNLKSILVNRSQFNNNINLEKFLSLFKDNFFGVRIDSRDSEQIINITKNVFSFSKQNFYNNEELKNIKIFTDPCNSTILLKIDNSIENKEKPSLFDLYQFILTLLYVLISLKSTSTLVRFLKEKHNNAAKDQNSPIMEIINTKKFNKNDIDYLFSKDNKNMKLNFYFAYFLPKTVFSIELKEKNEYYGSSKSEYLLADITIKLIKPLPETDLLKLLTNTNNNVSVLSATTGFDGLYTDQYSRDFLEHYSNIFNFEMISRNNSELQHLMNIKEERDKFRKVTIVDIKDDKIEKLNSPYKEFVSDFSKKSNIYRNRNQHQESEFKRTINAIFLSAQKRENSLLLTRSHEAFNEIIEYISDNRRNDIKILENTSNKIFVIEIKDNNQTIKLKIILFDADLATKQIIKENMLIREENEIIVFVSSYKSAGTGLNYFVSYGNINYEEGHKVDFQTIYLLTTPFYSNTNISASEITDINNFITLLKYQSSPNQANINIEDFNKSLFCQAHREALNKEHQYSIYKTINQAVGRIERKDNTMHSFIYIDENLKLDIGLSCSKIKNNNFITKSLSHLNHKLFEDSINSNFKNSLNSSQIIELNKKSKRKEMDYQKMFEYFLTTEIKNTRKNKCLPILNEALRSSLAYEDPETYIKNLKNILPVPELIEFDFFGEKVKYSSISRALDSLYLDKEDINKNNILFNVFRDYDYFGSDQKYFFFNDIKEIKDGFHKYNPFKIIIPDNRYMSDPSIAKDEEVKQILSILPDKERVDNFKRFLPNPNFLPLLKGIVGEKVFEKTLQVLEVDNVLTYTEILSKFRKLYELYDFFIEKDDELICVDVKSWSLSEKNTTFLEDFQLKVKRKYETLVETNKKLNLYSKINVIYLNINIGDNSIHKSPEKNLDIYFLNLFKKIEYYEPKAFKKFNSDYKKTYNIIEKKITVNETLKKILGI